MFPEIVAAPRPKLVEEVGRPIGVAVGVVNFVGVVEEGAQWFCVASGERPVEFSQI